MVSHMATTQDGEPMEYRDPIEQARELFGDDVAERLRKRYENNKPTVVEVDFVTGHRSYSRADD